MTPIGLTMKKGRNKYQHGTRGELMLIHQCTECRALSINRIAADDDAETITVIFQESLAKGIQIHAVCQEHGIVMLKADDTRLVYTQLYGHSMDIPTAQW